jgi:hypothetical protein
LAGEEEGGAGVREDFTTEDTESTEVEQREKITTAVAEGPQR